MILISKEKCLPYRDTGKGSPGCVRERTQDWCEMRGLRLAGVEGRGSAYQDRKGEEDELRENLKHKEIRKGYC